MCRPKRRHLGNCTLEFDKETPEPAQPDR